MQVDFALLLNANAICSSGKYYFAIREPILSCDGDGNGHHIAGRSRNGVNVACVDGSVASSYSMITGLAEHGPSDTIPAFCHFQPKGLVGGVDAMDDEIPLDRSALELCRWLTWKAAQYMIATTVAAMNCEANLSSTVGGLHRDRRDGPCGFIRRHLNDPGSAKNTGGLPLVCWDWPWLRGFIVNTPAKKHWLLLALNDAS